MLDTREFLLKRAFTFHSVTPFFVNGGDEIFSKLDRMEGFCGTIWGAKEGGMIKQQGGWHHFLTTIFERYDMQDCYQGPINNLDLSLVKTH